MQSSLTLTVRERLSPVRLGLRALAACLAVAAAFGALGGARHLALAAWALVAGQTAGGEAVAGALIEMAAALGVGAAALAAAWLPVQRRLVFDRGGVRVLAGRSARRFDLATVVLRPEEAAVWVGGRTYRLGAADLERVAGLLHLTVKPRERRVKPVAAVNPTRIEGLFSRPPRAL